ncbi:MAG: hypothetical protein ACI86H_002901 [bacterium]|jgi:uncharacterized protein YajQ (UPF0234 family)
MPSFDIVSEINLHEATNAIDQANREVSTRFDFKGTNANFEQKEKLIILTAPSDFQLQQMRDILRAKLNKRNVDIKALDIEDPHISGSTAKQNINLIQGIETELGKKIIKIIKDSKIKLQTAINDNKVRVSGKKRDDLQKAMALLKESNFDIPIQFNNFRD